MEELNTINNTKKGIDMKRLFFIMLIGIAALVSNAQDAAEKINAANEALQAKDYAKAFTLYEEALNNIGDVQVDNSINYNVGFAAYKADNYEGAIKYFNLAIEAEANVANSYEYIANSYNKLKKYAKAVETYEKAASISEAEDAKSMVYNGAIAAYKGKLYDKAIELFGKSVENGYKGETALFYKAVVLKKQDKDDEYKATLEEGAEKFPGDKKIAPALAKIYVSEGNETYKKGVEILNAANQKVNDGSLSTEDDAYAAEVTKAKAEFEVAAEILEKAVKLDASNANASTLLDACKKNLTI